MKRAVIAALMLAAAVCAAQPQPASAQDIAGDWRGTLAAGGAELRLALHITRTPQGALAATLDSLDQGASGIPVTAISLDGARLRFEVASVRGSYEGTVKADGSQIDGTWTQGQGLALTWKRLTPATTAVSPADLAGTWMGTLYVGPVKLRIVFHLRHTAEGLGGSIDSPDQGASGMPISSLVIEGQSLAIKVNVAGASYDAKVSPDRSSIEGKWIQGGGSLPLVLSRVNDAATLERRRPQMPKEPLPYRTEDVVFSNPAADIKLAGTLTLPPGKAPFAAALLITGSGPQDRDETLLGHKPFLVLADYLTRNRIAVLRVDDRGIGKSGGKFSGATSADFATDAEAAVAYLKSRAEVDPRRIGLIGHSEGGLVAPMVAARNPEIAFVVLLAGPGVSGAEILVEQVRALALAGGQSPAEADKAAATQRELMTLVLSEKDEAALQSKLRERLAGKLPEGQIGMQLKAVASPWFRYFVAYDPAPALRKLKCPVLAIIGEKDTQVPPKQNLPAIRASLSAAGNRNFELVELPGLNHLFQTAKTGLPGEYGEIEETMSPLALEKIAGWIRKQEQGNAGAGR